MYDYPKSTFIIYKFKSIVSFQFPYKREETTALYFLFGKHRTWPALRSSVQADHR